MRLLVLKLLQVKVVKVLFGHPNFKVASELPWQYTRPDVLFWTVKNGRLHAVTKEAKGVQAKKCAIYG